MPSTRKVKDYIVVVADPESIAQKVMEKIKSGYQPYGGLAVNDHDCLQAMVKFSELDDPAPPGPRPPITVLADPT